MRRLWLLGLFLRYVALVVAGLSWDDASVWWRILFVSVLVLMWLAEVFERRYWRDSLAILRERERGLVDVANELARAAQSPVQEAATGTRPLCPKCSIPLRQGQPIYACAWSAAGEHCPPAAAQLRRRRLGLKQ